MTDIFESPRWTLERARHHIRDLNQVVRDFIDPSPWTYVVDKKFKPGKEVHKIVFTRKLPYGAACMLFDAANNLRTVLDQVGHASSIAAGIVPPTKTDPKITYKTNFPFGDTLAQIENHRDGRKGYRHLPPEVLNLFLGFKPYEGGNDTLWALNKLCNTKKHCALVPITVLDARANFSATLPDGTPIGIDGTPTEDGAFKGWDPDKPEMILVTVPAGLDPQVRGHFGFQVAISDIEVLRRRPTIEVLNDMTSIVESILMATEAECRRLRFIT